MIISKGSRAARASLAAAAITAVALTGCSSAPEVTEAPPQNTTQATESSQPSSETSEPSESSETSETSESTSESPTESSSSSSESSSSSSSASGSAAEGREVTNLPSGPIKSAKALAIGGYRTSGEYGKPYTVMEVSATAAGQAKLKYVFLDAAGKKVAEHSSYVKFAANPKQTIVDISTAKVPQSTKRVEVAVETNTELSSATVALLQNGSLKLNAGDPITVTGKYRAYGSGSMTQLNVLCLNKNSSPRAAGGSTSAPDPKASSFTDFEIKLNDAKSGFVPDKCWVSGR